MKQQQSIMLPTVSYRWLFQGWFARISILTFCMLFVLMYFMYIMYMLCFCTLCSYATCEWPEFYVNKDMFCSVQKILKNADKILTFFLVPQHILQPGFKSCMFGRKVIYVRCINCSCNNVAKGICLLADEKAVFVYTWKISFERYIPLTLHVCFDGSEFRNWIPVYTNYLISDFSSLIKKGFVKNGVVWWTVCIYTFWRRPTLWV